MNVVGVHAEVVPVGRDVVEFDVVAPPEGLTGIGKIDVFQRQMLGVTKGLGGSDRGILHGHVLGVPDAGVGIGLPGGVIQGRVIGVP